MTFLYGVSRFLFTALALAVVLSLFASYFVAMTVVPLFCAKLIKGHPARWRRSPAGRQGLGRTLQWLVQRKFKQMLDRYEGLLKLALVRPVATVLGITGIFVFSLGALSVWLARPISRAPIPASLSST